MGLLVGVVFLLQSQDELEKLKREVEASRRRQEELERRVDSLQKEQEGLLDRIVSQRQEKDKEAETIFDEGFWFVGKDDRLRIGGSGQLDGRFFREEDGDSHFLVRRARLFATGVLEEK